MKERAPKVSQGTPKVTQKGPKGSQKGAQSKPAGAKSAPTGAERKPKVSQMAPKMGGRGEKRHIKDKVAKKVRKRASGHYFPRTILGAIFHQKTMEKTI